jgi:hypothetical protein
MNEDDRFRGILALGHVLKCEIDVHLILVYMLHSESGVEEIAGAVP